MRLPEHVLWRWLIVATLLLAVITCLMPVASAPERVRSATAREARAIGHPEWPALAASATDGAAASSYQPATLTFPDGSSAVLYPDRVRSAWGRPVKISVERFDATGKPLTGVRDMELVIDSGGTTFKAGFTEYAKGRYESELRGDALAIGRADVLLIASQSTNPNKPIAMANAIIAVDVVGGVRMIGQPIARRDGDRLLVDVHVYTRTAGHVTISGGLLAGTEPIADISGEADVAEGASIVTLDAGSLIKPDDPRSAKLALADVTATTLAGGAEQWTDFWRGARQITTGEQR